MRKTIALLALAALACPIQAQQFYNLTADEVRIDSVLPAFATSRPLPANYADSIYSVRIEYPEYIDMSEADIRRYLAITGEAAPATPDITAEVGINRKKASLDIHFTPIVCRDGRYQKLVSFMLAVDAKPRTALRKSKATSVTAASSSDASSRYASHSVLREGEWAKISVSESGVYELTDELIRKAGFTDLSKVRLYGYGGARQPETLTADYLTSTDDLKEVATCNVGGRRLFHAQGPVSWSSSAERVLNPYSTLGYYFLTQGDTAPLTVDSATFVASYYPAEEDYHTLYEVDNYAWYEGGRNLYDSKLYTVGTANTYSLASAGSGSEGQLRVVLSAYTKTGAATATVSVNGTEVGTVTVSRLSSDTEQDYAKGKTGTAVFTVSNLAADNTVTITQTAGGSMRLDYIALRTTEPKALPQLSTATFPTPDYVYRITNQDHHADEVADIVVIIPTSQKLLTQVQRYKALHEKYDSLSVRIVPADELYNEFSSGTPDATAYRRYMKMLYDRAGDDESKMPRFLTLFGDAAWDNRMVLANWKNYSPDDFLLCYESDNSFSQVLCFVADDFFCMLDDGERLATERSTSCSSTGKPDIAVGRFPVRTEAEAKIMVDKLEAYLSGDNAGAWQNTVVLMGDDGNNNLHMEAADDVATVVEKHNPTVDVRRVMWDAYALETSSTGYRHPDATKLIKQYMKNGALVMNYNGHGSAVSISHEMVLTLTDFKQAVSKKLPLWVTASCDIMPFDGSEENIGEQALLNSAGGAVAFFGTTRTVYTNYNRNINMAFMKKLFEKDDNGQRLAIGEAIRQAKVMLVEGYYDETTTTSDGRPITLNDLTQNKLQYSLLGDPALTLAYPTPSVAIDSINGTATADGTSLTMGAGSKVTVKGRVLSGGQTDANFYGTLTALAREGKQTVTCRNGAQADADKPYTYEDWQSQVFNGTDSVSGGHFSFSFVVPKDISYNDSAAQVLVYALSADRQTAVAGVNSQLRFNGSSSLGKDSIGPSIYCYLNSTAFVNGGTVNSTPYFVAEITDEDGINATGSGIGHDLQLVIDGELAKTYSLNDYFTFDFGSYQTGTVGYQIPALADGPHKLRFQAWDVLNNASVAELAFNVQSGSEASIYNVYATKNPASTSTSFRITHDRPGAELTVRLELFDMTGRALWSKTLTETTEENTLTVDWDLTIDGGRRLGTGVYLYRAGISCEGSEYTTQSKKLIIFNNK